MALGRVALPAHLLLLRHALLLLLLRRWPHGLEHLHHLILQRRGVDVGVATPEPPGEGRPLRAGRVVVRAAQRPTLGGRRRRLPAAAAAEDDVVDVFLFLLFVVVFLLVRVVDVRPNQGTAHHLIHQRTLSFHFFLNLLK